MSYKAHGLFCHWIFFYTILDKYLYIDLMKNKCMQCYNFRHQQASP